MRCIDKENRCSRFTESIAYHINIARKCGRVNFLSATPTFRNKAYNRFCQCFRNEINLYAYFRIVKYSNNAYFRILKIENYAYFWKTGTFI